jgi:hypothetical protein
MSMSNMNEHEQHLINDDSFILSHHFVVECECMRYDG